MGLSSVNSYRDYIEKPYVIITIGVIATLGFAADSLLFTFSGPLKTLNYICSFGSLAVLALFLSRKLDPYNTLGGLSIVFFVNLLIAPFLEIDITNFSTFYLRNSLFFWVLIPVTGLIWNIRVTIGSALIYFLQYLAIVFLTGDPYLTQSLLTVVIVLAIYTFVSTSIIQSIHSNIDYQSELIRILEKKTEELDITIASKNKLLSIISHDLRTPMMSLSNLSYMINEEVDEDQKPMLHEYTQIMDQTIQSTNELVTNLLEWSRSQNNSIQIKPKHIDIQDICNNVSELLQHTARQKNISFDLGPFHKPHVFADPDSLHTILRNLIGNSLKFTPNGGTVSVYTKVNDGHDILFIEDDGVGMDSQTLQSVKDPSLFNSNKGTDNEGGSGIGFNLCMELMDLHRGKLEVESAPDQGTIISLYFPSQSA